MSRFIEDLNNHKELVRVLLNNLAENLKHRGIVHDNSKYDAEEAEQFETISDIRREDFETYEEWFNTTKPMLDKALKHHYENNRHHPEHFKNGVEDMNLLDVLEMVVDWEASASARNTTLDPEYSFKRFGISPQLQKIIINTLNILYDVEE